jgi:hypothetical protein
MLREIRGSDADRGFHEIGFSELLEQTFGLGLVSPREKVPRVAGRR